MNLYIVTGRYCGLHLTAYAVAKSPESAWQMVQDTWKSWGWGHKVFKVELIAQSDKYTIEGVTNLLIAPSGKTS